MIPPLFHKQSQPVLRREIRLQLAVTRMLRSLSRKMFQEPEQGVRASFLFLEVSLCL